MMNLVLNKMQETFQSNTLDWSSLVYSLFFNFIVQSYLRQFFIDSLQIFRIRQLLLDKDMYTIWKTSALG